MLKPLTASAFPYSLKKPLQLLTRLNFWDDLPQLVKLRKGLDLCRDEHKLLRLNISESCCPEGYCKLVVREVVKS